MHEANPTARKAFSSTSSSRRSSNGCASGHDVEEEEEEQLFQEASSSTRTNSVDGSGTPFAAAVSATPVTDFYSNATVLITGGTGFVGKVLTEKLLRSFGLRKIYMLIRSKDKMSVQERLKGFFNESIFNRMREESPQLLAKVHPIRADYSAIDLDIDSADRAMLSSEVQCLACASHCPAILAHPHPHLHPRPHPLIVFNVVASVKFNEKLSDAIDINVLGTKKILDLAMEMKHLKDTPGTVKVLLLRRLRFSGRANKAAINSYLFAVMSTYKDPFPGWTDNLYGPSGLCTWSARGLVRCIYGKASCKANMVPADYVVNAMIATAWDIARRLVLQRTAHNTQHRSILLKRRQRMCKSCKELHRKLIAFACLQTTGRRWKFANTTDGEIKKGKGRG
ncbi:GM13919 [Drosophila sechellia]|uniref:Fatty acyl-CoA reductase n=1 Tax=Drosophila sechellia TaxID=7238 RepID=B4HUF8_DROSE|nr:GM13919 [Drosophila sechellia]